jgi:hypothetical protein
VLTIADMMITLQEQFGKDILSFNNFADSFYKETEDPEMGNNNMGKFIIDAISLACSKFYYL